MEKSFFLGPTSKAEQRISSASWALIAGLQRKRLGRFRFPFFSRQSAATLEPFRFPKGSLLSFPAELSKKVMRDNVK